MAKTPLTNSEIWANQASSGDTNIDQTFVDSGWQTSVPPKRTTENGTKKRNDERTQMLEQEVNTVLTQNGINPDGVSIDQLYQALRRMGVGAIGEIKMFYGYGWVDNSTLPGWWACVASNTSKTFIDASGATRNVPDLSARLPRASSSKNTYNSYGGSDSFSLSESNMPSHRHNINYSGSTSGAGDHRHSALYGDSTGTIYTMYHAPDKEGAFGGRFIPVLNDSNGSTETMSTTEQGFHSHNFSISSNTSYTGSGSSVQHIPKYHEVLFIIRCE